MQSRDLDELEARIAELEARILNVRLAPDAAAFSAGERCTLDCTYQCTNTCTDCCQLVRDLQAE